jgi:thiol-disulfide isomerase/thioredoxin
MPVSSPHPADLRSPAPARTAGRSEGLGLGWFVWGAAALGALAFSVWWLVGGPAAPAPVTQETPAPTTVPTPTAAARVSVAPAEPAPSAAPAGAPATCPLLATPQAAPVAGAFVSPNWYEGAGGYEAARRDQDMRCVPTFVYVFTDWCPYCRAFERDLLNAPEVEHFLRDAVVKLRVNPEQSADQRALAERLGAHSYPRLLLLLDGEEPRPVSRQVERDGGAAMRSPAEFVAEIERVRDSLLGGRIRRARALWQSGDAPAAIALIDRVLALRPDLAAAHVERALAQDQRQATDEALDDLRRAYTVDAQQEAVFLALDQVLARRQRWDETAACWTQLLQQQPRNAGALLGRSVALARKGERERAAADARESCALGEPRACALLGSLGR